VSKPVPSRRNAHDFISRAVAASRTPVSLELGVSDTGNSLTLRTGLFFLQTNEGVATDALVGHAIKNSFLILREGGMGSVFLLYV
jgi:hypothetical protein